MSSQDESPAPGLKSKQQRIRDNQRRSRARRQEYLADLEKRLRECHTLCRDADIQRSAYVELQRENACLRTLLGLSGVSTSLIDSFIRQNAASIEQPDCSTAMRQLKPKLSQPMLSTNSSGSSHDAAATSLPSYPRSPVSHASLAPNTIVGNTSQLYHSPSTYSTSNTSPLPSTTNAQSYEEFDWIFDQLPQPVEESEETDCCGTFLVPFKNVTGADDSSSVLCSVAKDLLDQYNIPPEEMDGIKLRLAGGLSRPGVGKACRVNNHVLFPLLNEISCKYG